MNEIISVIIPVYNAKDVVNKCVESVRNQTYHNLEIILVDDGSIDGSSNICDELKELDNRIIVIHKENGGSTSSRNAGLKIATGDYIGFVDCDDWIEPDMYELLLEGCVANNAEICVGRQFLDRGDTSHIEAERSITEGIIDKKDEIIPHHIIYSDDYEIRGISPNLWDKLFDVKIIKKHQSIVDEKTRFAEDDLCVYSALLDAERVALIDKPIYHYCLRDGSVTQKKDEEYFEKITLFYKQMKQVFAQSDYYDLLIQKLDRYMVELIIRGLNKNFGFNFGQVVPFFIPPYAALQELGAHSIILYGAGDVGRDYYSELTKSGYEIVKWCDKRWATISNSSMYFASPEDITGAEFDIVLIAADSEDLMTQIFTYLTEELHIPEDRIVHEFPTKIISSLK